MKRLWKNRGGFTLVEIIVTFTLTAIFMSSAAMVLTTFMRSHTVANAVATEQDVAAIVMDTITGSLDGARYEKGIFKNAKPDGETWPLSGADEKWSLWIRDEGKEIWYVDGESENLVKMYRTEEDGKGYLALDYFVRPDNPETLATDTWERAHWQLGSGVYQNCSLKSFKVEKMDGGDNSCLTVTLVIENGLAGEEHKFTMKRTFECYNLAAGDIKEGS